MVSWRDTFYGRACPGHRSGEAIRRSRCEGAARGNLKSSLALLGTWLRSPLSLAKIRKLKSAFPLSLFPPYLCPLVTSRHLWVVRLLGCDGRDRGRGKIISDNHLGHRGGENYCGLFWKQSLRPNSLNFIHKSFPRGGFQIFLDTRLILR